MSTNTILIAEVEKSVEITKRQYDGKYAVWRHMLSFDEDIQLSTFWEIIGVHDSYSEAARQKDRYRINQKTGN